jgi:hypothetical protein
MSQIYGDLMGAKLPHQNLVTMLKKMGFLKGNGSAVHLLDSFTRFVGSATKTSEAEVFWHILWFSWTVSSVPDLNKVLEEHQVRYLSKLGDYTRVLQRISSLLGKGWRHEDHYL